MKKTDFWLVTVKSGHVGKNFFIAVTYAVIAENGKEAARIGRMTPRAKHDVKDCIISVKNVSYEQYMQVCMENFYDPYLNCKNHQEQLLYMDEILNRIQAMDKPKKYKCHRHSLRHIWNNDEEFEEIA